jgi:hypothetical protein
MGCLFIALENDLAGSNPKDYILLTLSVSIQSSLSIIFKEDYDHSKTQFSTKRSNRYS